MPGEPSRSDLVAGRVVRRDGRTAELRTPDDRLVTIHLTDVTYAQQLRNLGEGYRDATGRIDELLAPGAYVFSYGPVYSDTVQLYHQSTALVFAAEPDRRGPFHEPGWWTGQLRHLARFYRRSQFGERRPDFADYRTEIHSSGGKTDRHVQETDTISRFVYGMASAYMLTGEDDFLDVAEAGSRYLREHLRFEDLADGVVYWYHGVDVAGTRERRLFASEFGDDYRAIPAYEQIYAMVGLVQTYRLTQDPALMKDIEGTVRLFDRFFADHRLGGYYSHIDPVSMSPHDDALGPNRSRKNWNSIGDHAPAYLINLYLATGEERYRRMLEHTFDMIVTHLPDRTEQASPFVFERFHGDWTPDRTWGWQQDRAVVGHNLKIVWNLLRMHADLPKVEYRRHAERIAAAMPRVGRDPRRGGWYDMVERVARDGRHAFPWHDRKTWWQQEQAILAYLILAGSTGDAQALRHADESMAFYNAFFLDHDEGAVHFTVTADGLPYHVGDERLKGSHAMSMYHKAELCFLAEVYLRLLVHDDPLELWFRPNGDPDTHGRVLRVAPDLLPPGRVRLDAVWIDGAPYQGFDSGEMAVRLPDSAERMTVKVRLVPTGGSR